jgi:hypothetical protein
MAKLTWLELQELIDNTVVDKNADVVIYDMSTGDELECDLIELNNAKNDSWQTVIAINMEGIE